MATLNSDMNYGKKVAFAQATKDRKLKNKRESEGRSKAQTAGNLGGSSGGGRSAFRGGPSGPSQSFAQTSMSPPPSGDSQGNMGPHQQGWPGGRFQQQWRPPCPKCGRKHFGVYFMDLLICYVCGVRGHIHRDCRSSHLIMGRGAVQPARSITTKSTAPPPARGTLAPAGCGAARGGAQSSRGPRRF
ncbi:uncharacterized protein [Nicotiana tomentosiformis]|uniref:uncharacterized protein n=1 Tax=Nicotiana tomentosiformis TaxID=4098 RepID=UPI00388C6040